MEDEDDESVSSMTMEDISMEEETPDFSDTSFSPELHEDLKPYIIKLTNELHKGVTDPNDSNLEGVFRALLNLICPVAFKVIKGDEDGKLDIPVDLEIMSALEFELVSILMESSSPYDQIEEFIKLQEPSQVCGKIFAPYEFTYSCRDCGVDNTCVMCNDCFSKSIHQNHNYRMSQSSGGGGCCDCGDPEAWKDGYVCTDHAPNKEKPAREKTPRELQLQKRAEILFLALVRFIFELVIPDVQMFSFSEDSDSEMVKYYNSSSYLEPENKHMASTYALMLYNDEVHTYDDVEKMLKNSVNATTEQAKGYATVVDRIGRTILKQVSYEEARRIQDIVIKETEGNTLYQRQRLGLHNGGPIKSLIIDRRILGLQEVAVRLLKKINSLTCKLGKDHETNDVLRNAFTIACGKKLWVRDFEEIPISTPNRGHIPNLLNKTQKLQWFWSEKSTDDISIDQTVDRYCTLEVMLLSDIYTWKNVRMAMIKTLIENYLKEYENKLQLSKLFSNHYREIYNNVDKGNGSFMIDISTYM